MSLKSEINLPELIPFNNNGKWGYCKPLNYSEQLRNQSTKINNLVLECIYDKAEPFENGLALVKMSDKYFFINENGGVHNNIKYDKIYPYSEGLAAVVKNNKIGFINKQNNLIIPFDYLHKDENGFNFNDFIFKDGLVKVRKLIDNEILYGFIDKNGQVVIPFDYSYLSDFSNGVLFVIECDRLYLEYGFSHDQLKTIKKSLFILDKDNIKVKHYVGDFDVDSSGFIDDFAIVSIHREDFKLSSFINSRGERIHAFYNDVRPFNEGFAYVSISGNYSFPQIDEDRIKHANFVDKSGFEISKIRFEHASDFLGGFATIRMNKKWGLLDNKGEITLPCISEEFINRQGEICIIKINNKYGLINAHGVSITGLIYDEIKLINENIAIVKVDNKWGFFNTNGKIITECIYDEYTLMDIKISKVYRDDFVIVKRDGNYGFIRFNGTCLDCKYYSIELVLENLVAVNYCDNNDYYGRYKIGFFNVNAKQLSEFVFSRYKVISNELIAVNKSKQTVKEQYSKWGIINREGNLLVDFLYDDLIEYDEEVGCIVKQDGKYGLIDKFGNIKIDFSFQRISILGNKEYLEVAVKSRKLPETKIFNLKENKVLDYIPDNVMKRVIYKSTLMNKYKKCYEFKNNIALIYNREQFGYIDIFGNEYFKHNTTTSEYYEEVNSLRKRANPIDAFDDYEQYIDWYDN